MRLRHMGLYAGGLHVSMRHRTGRGWSDELRFNETQDTLQFIHALTQIWERRPGRGRAPFQVGVVLFNLVELPGHTPDLFTHEQEQARGRLHDIVDALNRAYGKNTVYFGGAHGATGYAPMRIAFTRIPQPEIEEIDPEAIEGHPAGKKVTRRLGAMAGWQTVAAWRKACGRKPSQDHAATAVHQQHVNY